MTTDVAVSAAPVLREYKKVNSAISAQLGRLSAAKAGAEAAKAELENALADELLGVPGAGKGGRDAVAACQRDIENAAANLSALRRRLLALAAQMPALHAELLAEQAAVEAALISDLRAEWAAACESMGPVIGRRRAIELLVGPVDLPAPDAVEPSGEISPSHVHIREIEGAARSLVADGQLCSLLADGVPAPAAALEAATRIRDAVWAGELGVMTRVGKTLEARAKAKDLLDSETDR
jgi:hypothetical protein